MDYQYKTLRERPELKEAAASWFHSKWHVPKEAYLACMDAYLNRETEYGWYLCLRNGRIIGGMGVIENDFHDRKDLSPNVCAVYTEEAFRGRGIAGHLLNMTVGDMRSKGITPLYLVTDHTGFYERYGWEFYCMAQGAGIRVPEMIAVDIDTERIVKKYIEGETVFEYVRRGISVEPYLPQVREMAALAKACGLNIDYFPTNFVVHDGLIWYVDYECNGYMDEWSFDSWGVKYWSRTPEFEEYLRKHEKIGAQ